MVPQDPLCMFNFKTSLDILGIALIVTSVSLTHVLVLVSVIMFSTLTYNNLKASAQMSGRAWSSKDRAMSVRMILQCLYVALVTIFIISEAVLSTLSVDNGENVMQWVGFILVQITAAFNPLLNTLMAKNVFSLFQYHSKSSVPK